MPSVYSSFNILFSACKIMQLYWHERLRRKLFSVHYLMWTKYNHDSIYILPHSFLPFLKKTKNKNNKTKQNKKKQNQKQIPYLLGLSNS